jgi:hypothetical protein
MEPDDPVMIPMTRMEAARIHAALSALVSLQKMMPPTMLSAMRLNEAVDVIEGVLPRFQDAFPEGMTGEDAPTVSVIRVEVVGNDAKTYEKPMKDPFDVRVKDLRGMPPKQAAAIFASPYDEAIRELKRSLVEFTDYSDENFVELLDRNKELLLATMPVPEDLTVSESTPYVEASDLITLGSLAHEMYLRQGQIEDKSKPF